jgi:hypothetical protein
MPMPNSVALALLLVLGVWFLAPLVVAFLQRPRAMTAKLCGELALFFALLAILWAAHLGDKYGWLT